MTTEKDVMALAVIDAAALWCIGKSAVGSDLNLREAGAHLSARLLHLTQLAEHHRLNAEAASESVKFYTRKLDDAEAGLAAVRGPFSAWRQEAERSGTSAWADGYIAGIRRCLKDVGAAVDAARGDKVWSDG